MATSSRTRAAAKPRKPRLKQPLLRNAAAAGLMAGTKSKQLSVRVTPALFEAAAKRAGTHSPAAVVEAALAMLATPDTLGPWLASRWGALADVDPAVLAELEF